MRITMRAEMKDGAVPDTGTAEEYFASMSLVVEQMETSLAEFAKNRIDRKTILKDRAGKPCGEIEILRF